MPRFHYPTRLLQLLAALTRNFFNVKKSWWGSAAGLAALTMILRRFLAKQPNLIIDYTKAARRIDSRHEFDEYDFIIVGGGTAGCVLASRLSEDPNLRVLVIEAGTSGKALLESRIPSAFSKLLGSHHDYNLYTEPQQHAGSKKKYWPRGRMLGGCSSINALMAQYGAPSDYDEFADITGDDSWSWKNFEKYFRKFESYTPDPRFPHVDTSQRGSSGPVTVGYNAYIWKGSPLFVEACVNAGVQFSPDFTTSKGTLGANKVVTYIDERGERVSAESAYLTPEVLARPNLKVATLARVTKILFETSAAPRAVGVEFAEAKDRGASGRFRARALKEVIVCGGAVHTPQILMLSGIGPAPHLAKHKIPIVLDSPGVGANLSDHPTFKLRLQDKLGISLNYLTPYDLTSSVKFWKAFVQHQVFGTGPLSSNVGESVAFFRADDPRLFPPAEYNNDIEDSTSGPDAPDIELIVAPVLIKTGTDVLQNELHGYTLLATLLRPTSVGNIQLKSSCPWDDPLIDPRYLSTQHDLDVLVRGIRGAFKIAHTYPLSTVTDICSTHSLLDHHFEQLSDQELGEIVRDRVETLYHPFGTCTMGKAENPAAVLDSQMRVRGAVGLRVCDASVFPKLVSGHTTAPILAAAEKLADIIKAEYAVIG
ncbi:GMC oxidoreductase [Paxillus rubicundulus Ve08.2h10]|uniref:GMC oxidoreductase n=1 Tax=Paxillus rubicundulus Ve08.2h10 TaxID=930991 RepID=A0A0D0ECL9_9AGAM|nr:GMC oxidoreductase [Paxillus rubicundulus Ve08.2h10]